MGDIQERHARFLNRHDKRSLLSRMDSKRNVFDNFDCHWPRFEGKRSLQYSSQILAEMDGIDEPDDELRMEIISKDDSSP